MVVSLGVGREMGGDDVLCPKLILLFDVKSRGWTQAVPYNALALNDDDGTFSPLCVTIIQTTHNAKTGAGLGMCHALNLPWTNLHLFRASRAGDSHF